MGGTHIWAVVEPEDAGFLHDGVAPELRRFDADGHVTITLLAADGRQEARARRLSGGNSDPNTEVRVFATAGMLPVLAVAHDVEKLRVGLETGDVWVNGDAGPLRDRLDLMSLAQAYELPIKRLEQGIVTRMARQSVAPSRYIRALHYALSRSRNEENEHLLREMGFAGLVGVRSETEYAPTPALLDLLADERFLGVKESESACADLLERLGDHERAGKLRSLVRRWIRNRLWSVNQVPEMVAHNDDHAVAVDRNVAFLCEFITKRADDVLVDEKGVPRTGLSGLAALRSGEGDEGAWLSTRDLYLLAVAAWLHDWGHESMSFGDVGFVKDPISVRRFHGFMSSQLIGSSMREDAHGLAPTAKESSRRREEQADRQEVALLCAHHQGSSSCGPLSAEDLPQIIGPHPLGKSYTVEALSSFDEHVKTKLEEVDKSADYVKPSLERLKVLLAILRVADAADVGAHRTPDFDYQEGHRNSITDSLFQLRAPMEASDKDVLAWVREMASILEHISRLRERITQRRTASGKGQTDQGITIESVLEDEKSETNKLFAKAEPGPEGPSFMTSYWAYALHVVKQSAFYEAHHSVRCAVPFISAERRLKLAVVPYMERDEKIAWGVVERDILREFGKKRVPDRSKPIGDDDRGRKEPIRSAFEDQLSVPVDVERATIDGDGWTPPPAREIPPAPEPDADLVEADAMGAVWSATGEVVAKASSGVVSFASGPGLTDSYESVGLRPGAEIRLLAIASQGEAGLAMVADYPEGLALVGLRRAPAQLDGPGARAAAILPDVVLWASDAGVLRVRVLSGSRFDPPPWLAEGDDIHDLDAVLTAKGVVLAVLLVTPKCTEIRTGLWSDDNWLAGPSFPSSPGHRVRLSRRGAGERLLVFGAERPEVHVLGLADWCGTDELT